MPDLPQDLGRAPRTAALDPGASIEAGGVRVCPGPARRRLVLRGSAAAFSALGALPAMVGGVSELAGIAALCLGPDEWLVLGTPDDPGLLAVRDHDGPDAAATDVSQRQIALSLTGPRAADLLNAGCPLDLHPLVFTPGRCTRTLLGKAEIVLWRTAPDSFQLEVARSFSAYVWAFLAEAASMLPRAA